MTKIRLSKNYPRILEEMKQSPPSDLYQRKGSLVRVVRIKEGTGENKSLVIQRLQLPTLKEMFMCHVDFYSSVMQRGKRCEVSAIPNNEIINMFLLSGEYDNIDVIRGISETPFMRADGTICEEAGFDENSGFFYNPSCQFGKVPDVCTYDDAAAAYGRLLDLFADFPFTSNEYKAVPIANILTILARPMFGNVPAFVYEASSAGSGKTLIIDTVSLICFGRETAKQTWPEGRDNNQELEKLLASVAIDASQMVVFDNISRDGVIGGAPLDKVITSNGSVKFRLLGKNESPELPWNTVLVFTGNNAVASVRGDTRRRILPCRIEPDRENPETRSNFKYFPLLPHVRNNRANFVIDGLTILRHWIQNGMVGIPNPHGSFEGWSNAIIGSIIGCGGPDISNVFKSVSDTIDEEYSEIAKLLSVLNDTVALGGTISNLIGLCENGNNQLNAALSVFSKDLKSRQIGRLFSSIEGRIYNGYKLVRKGSYRRAITWNVIKTVADDVAKQEEMEY